MPTLMKHPLVPRFSILAVACLCSVATLTRPLEAAPRFEPLYGFELHPQQPAGSLVADAAGNLYGTSGSGAYGAGTIYKIATDGTITTLHHFDMVTGGLPGGYLTAGSDGNFYGTATHGGASGRGTIYRITPAGEFTLLHSFSGGADGAEPCQGLLRAPQDGNFYGYTSQGGANGRGTFFRITPAGVLTTMEDWARNAVGWGTSGNIIQGSDTNFYALNGSSMSGGPVLIRITPSGTPSVIANFPSVPVNGVLAPGSLMQASDGNFYGLNYTAYAGLACHIFKVQAGVASVLAELDPAVYYSPTGKLVEAADGMLYGASAYGGAYGGGTVFRVGKAGGVSTFASLNPESGGPVGASGGLVLQADGSFIGLSREGGADQRGTAFRVSAAGEVSVISSFKADPDCRPDAKLLAASDGNLYGTTGWGGSIGNAVIKITPQGEVTTIPSLSYDGNASYMTYESGFVEGDDGTLFGSDYNGELGRGEVFSLNAEFQREEFFAFPEDSDKGGINGITKGADGNIYGTTRFGGSFNSGVVFKLDPEGAFTQLADFSEADVNSVSPGLVHSSDGNLYGTTTSGGAEQRGTVFKVGPDGVLSTLAEFNTLTGWSPTTGLIEASDGNFYGITNSGGADNAGTIFKVTPAGEITPLHSFIWSAGGSPVGQLVEAGDGSFYGATYGGLSDLEDQGILFRITKAGEFSTVVDLGGLKGGIPLAGLTMGNDGHLYGTTSEGGMTNEGKPAGGGEIFRLRLGAEVETGLATAIASSTATLNGTVNPSGHATTVSFQYGASPDLSSFSTVSAGTLPAGDEPVNVTAELTGLVPGATYYFRPVATNDENPQPQSGEIASFETMDPAEIVVATSNGFVLSDGSILVFGLTPVGSAGNLTLSISNTSNNTALTGVGATISGSGAGHFSVTGVPSATVEASSSTACTVRFQPASPGLKTANLTITSSDADEGSTTIRFYGIALPGFSGNW